MRSSPSKKGSLERTGPARNRSTDSALSASGSEELTRPLIATEFWKQFIRSSAFGATLAEAGASPLAIAQSECFVLRHGQRYDLVVFDPQFSSHPAAVRIKPTPTVYQPGQRIPGALSQLPWNRAPSADSTLSLAAAEAARAEEFQVLVLRTPAALTDDESNEQFVLTAAAPTPPWRIDPLPTVAVITTAGSFSTAGVFATNKAGQHGVTAALHAIGTATQVTIGGNICQVLSRDAISDSCFIEYPWQQVGTWGSAGPLRGLIPSQYSIVEFDGAVSGRMQTVVTAWSPDLIGPAPGNQVKIFTKVVTAPGDSGAALIDDANRIIGFSFWRTGFNAVAEFSVWIWAETVFDAHQLV